jgi:hypothetical protein
MCKSKPGYVCTLTLPIRISIAFSILLTNSVHWQKNRGNTIYMARWFSSSKLYDHMLACGKKAVCTVMPNRKEMPKQTLSKKLEKEGENCGTPRLFHGHEVDRVSRCVCSWYSSWDQTVCFAYVTSLRVEGKQMHIILCISISNWGGRTRRPMYHNHFVTYCAFPPALFHQ